MCSLKRSSKKTITADKILCFFISLQNRVHLKIITKCEKKTFDFKPPAELERAS